MLKQNSQRRSIPEFCLSIAGLTMGKRVLLKRNWLLASVSVCTAEVWIRVLPLILCLSDFVPLMKIVPATRQGVTVLTFNPRVTSFGLMLMHKPAYRFRWGKTAV